MDEAVTSLENPWKPFAQGCALAHRTVTAALTPATTYRVNMGKRRIGLCPAQPNSPVGIPVVLVFQGSSQDYLVAVATKSR